jgi:hypothetical protein
MARHHLVVDIQRDNFALCAFTTTVFHPLRNSPAARRGFVVMVAEGLKPGVCGLCACLPPPTNATPAFPRRPARFSTKIKRRLPRRLQPREPKLCP